jgi:hypothetical protein
MGWALSSFGARRLGGLFSGTSPSSNLFFPFSMPLPPSVRCCADSAALNAALGEYVASAASAAVAARGRFTLATSGGSLPKALGEALQAAAAGGAELHTDKWEVFYVDERVVPLDHADSNHAATVAAVKGKVREGVCVGGGGALSPSLPLSLTALESLPLLLPPCAGVVPVPRRAAAPHQPVRPHPRRLRRGVRGRSSPGPGRRGGQSAGLHAVLRHDPPRHGAGRAHSIPLPRCARRGDGVHGGRRSGPASPHNSTCALLTPSNPPPPPPLPQPPTPHTTAQATPC